MNAEPARPLAEMTVEQWADLDEDEEGELVDGRLEEDEMPTTLHEAIAAWIMRALLDWLAPRGGRVFGPELKMRVGPTRGRKADVSGYLPGRPLPARGVSATKRPPSIVVEVQSPRPRDMRRDRVAKLADYAAFGVTFYWLVDPVARTVEIHELGASGRYETALAAAEGVHAVPGCDGLALDLDALWADADELPEFEDD